MIRDFSVRLKPTNSKAKRAFIFCLILAFVFFVISAVLPLYNGLVGLISLVFLVISLNAYTKYLSCIYYYDITTDSDGTPLFIVRQIVGKRETTLCRIELADVVSLDREDRETRIKHKTPKELSKFNYSPTMDPEVSYRMITNGRYEQAEIVLEFSDEMAEMILHYAELAREMRINE